MIPSRYDLMKESLQRDEVDQEVYPDILSANYTSFSYDAPPIQLPPSPDLSEKMYYTTNSLYSEPYYDDIILNLNSVSHLSKLEEKTVIKFPVKTNLIEWITKEKERIVKEMDQGVQ